jgi:hypothetical protein
VFAVPEKRLPATLCVVALALHWHCMRYIGGKTGNLYIGLTLNFQVGDFFFLILTHCLFSLD